MNQIALKIRDGMVATRSGSWHHVRGKPVKSARGNPEIPRRTRYGMVYAHFRKDLMGRARDSRRQVWIEVNLHYWARRYGRCLSYMRLIWKKMQQDPIFNQNMVVRVHQVRLLKNGCPVIICAHQRNLAYDREPLLYERDRVSTRHVRTSWRSADISEPTGESLVSGSSHTNGFPSKEAAGTKNNGEAEKTDAGPPRPPPMCKNSHSLPLRSESNQSEREACIKSSVGNAKVSREHWICQQAMSEEGKKRLRKKAIWLAFECRGMHWDNCKVKFLMGHAIVFCMSMLQEGLSDRLILKAWGYAIHLAHQDSVDGMARVPCALALAHAKRWIAPYLNGSLQSRVSKIYNRERKATEFHNLISKPSAG